MRIIDAWTSWPDKWRPIEPYKDARGSRYKVTVVALYWAVKDLVRQFAV
jgi:hypothetical protein